MTTFCTCTGKVPAPCTYCMAQRNLCVDRLRWLTSDGPRSVPWEELAFKFWHVLTAFRRFKQEDWVEPTYDLCRKIDSSEATTLLVYVLLCDVMRPETQIERKDYRDRIWKALRVLYPEHMRDIREADTAERLLHTLLGGKKPTTQIERVQEGPLFQELVGAFSERLVAYPPVLFPDHVLWKIFDDKTRD